MSSNTEQQTQTVWKVTQVYDTLVPPLFFPQRTHRVLEVPVSELGLVPNISPEAKMAKLKKYLVEKQPPKLGCFFERIAAVSSNGYCEQLFTGFGLFEQSLLDEVQDMRTVKIRKSAWDTFVANRASALPLSEGFNLTIATAAFNKLKNVLKDCKVGAYWVKEGGGQEAMVTSNAGRHFFIVNGSSNITYYHASDSKEQAEAYITEFLEDVAVKSKVTRLFMSPSTIQLVSRVKTPAPTTK